VHALRVVRPDSHLPTFAIRVPPPSLRSHSCLLAFRCCMRLEPLGLAAAAGACTHCLVDWNAMRGHALESCSVRGVLGALPRMQLPWESVQDPAASYDQFGELHGAVAPAVAHNHRANEATPLLARLKTALKSKMRGGSGEVRQGTPGCNAVQHVATSGLHLPKVRRSFSYLDKNKTGTVNREDLRVVFRDIGIALDKKHELALMQAAAPRSARLGSARFGACVRACVRPSWSG